MTLRQPHRIPLLLSRLLVVAVPILIMLLGRWFAPVGAKGSDSDTLHSVWQRVQAAGRYDFSADVAYRTQIAGDDERFYVEGNADLAADQLRLRLWNGAGGVLAPGTELEVEVEGDVARTRSGKGHWQETENFTGAFAPGGDFTGFLAAASDVHRLPAEARRTPGGTLVFDRLGFRLGGPRFEAYLREVVTANLRRTGELPAGATVTLPESLRAMSGTGELWVGPDRLPLRQVVRLQLPAERGQPVAVTVTVDFSGFGGAGSGHPAGVAGAGWLACPTPWPSWRWS